MTFEKLLSDALDKVYGARGIVFLARDGEIVWQCAQRNVTNLDLLAAYHGITLTTCQRFADDFETGRVQTILCQYMAGICVIKALNDGYLLLMALDSDGNIGHAMCLLNELTPKMNAEIGA